MLKFVEYYYVCPSGNNCDDHQEDDQEWKVILVLLDGVVKWSICVDWIAHIEWGEEWEVYECCKNGETQDLPPLGIDPISIFEDTDSEYHTKTCSGKCLGSFFRLEDAKDFITRMHSKG